MRDNETVLSITNIQIVLKIFVFEKSIIDI